MGEMSDDANDRALTEYAWYLDKENMSQEEQITKGFLEADGEKECPPPDDLVLDLNPHRMQDDWATIEQILLSK